MDFPYYNAINLEMVNKIGLYVKRPRKNLEQKKTTVAALLKRRVRSLKFLV